MIEKDADMTRTGVYCIMNTVNRKKYVGSASKSFRQRWVKGHLVLLKAGRHHSRHLQAAWDKYGTRSFLFIVLEECPPEECIEREQYWINILKACDPDRGYNLSPTAGNTLGVKHTDEARKNMSEAQLAREMTQEEKDVRAAAVRRPEVREKIAKTLTGKKHSEETKRKMSKSHKGKKLSPEHCKAVGNGHRGKKLSAEHRKKIGDVQRGRKQSEETKRKRSEAMKGRVLSPEALANIREGKRRQGKDPEFRAKMSRVVAEVWRKRKEAANGQTPPS